MKRFVLFFTAIMAAAAFAPQASALPLFARQTGMACSACHFQHFPMLNSFGRAFKSSAFTMMGAQGKIEGDGLSIPANLNMAGLTTLGYEKSNATASATAPFKNDGNGLFYVPGNNGELSLFFGGRITDNAGFLTEIGMLGLADQSSAKMPILFEVTDGTRAGVVPFTTSGQGASYGFELLNTGANAVHQMSGVGGFNGAHSLALSAQQYIGTGTTATGLAFVASNPSGFVNLTKFNQFGTGDFTGGAPGNPAVNGNAGGGGLYSTYLRVVGMFDVAGWDAGVGIQSWSGDSAFVTPAGGLSTTKATALDGQMQGELGGMPVGFYFSYAKAPVVAAVVGGTAGNAFNMGGAFDKSSFNISGEVGVIAEKATLGAAIRRGKSGTPDAVSGANATDNAILLTATYKLAQNMMASLSYTSASGGYWDAVNTAATGSKTTTLNLFTLF